MGGKAGGTGSRWQPRIHFRDVHGRASKGDGIGGRDERTGRN